MAIGIDVVTENIRTLTTSPQTFSHAGGASAKSVLLFLVRNGTAVTSIASAASYGGVSLTYLTSTSVNGAEPGTVEVWYGNGISSGTQTVSYTPGTTGDDIQAVSVTLTCSTSGILCESINYLTNTSLANPQATGNPANHEGRAGYGFGVIFSGLAAVTSLTEVSGCTRLHDHDFGQQVSVVQRTTNEITSGAFTMGWTSAADDVAVYWLYVTERIFSATHSSGAGAQVSLSGALPSITQATWRWRNDDGSESAATWKAAAAADATFTVGANTKARIRFALTCPGGRSNFQPKLEAARLGAGGYTLTGATWLSQSDTLLADVMQVEWRRDTGDGAYLVDNNNSLIKRYTVASAWGLPSTYVDSYGYTSELNMTSSIWLSSTGTRMFIGGTNLSDAPSVASYTLSTAWVLASSASYVTSVTIPGTVYAVKGIAFKEDGTKLFVHVLVTGGTQIQRFNLSTAWDLSTLGASAEETFTTATGVDEGAGIAFSPDGNYMYYRFYDQGLDEYYIVRYYLPTAWSIGTLQDEQSISIGYNDCESVSLAQDGSGKVGAYTITGDYFALYGPPSGYNWFEVTTTSSGVRAVDTTNLTHAADTTQQLDTGSFVTPNSGVSETGTAGVDNDMDFTATYQKCEVEYAIEFVEADLADGETVRFRVKNVDVWTEV